MLDPPLSLFPSTIAIAISLLLLLPLAPPPRTWCWWYVHSMCASSSSCVRTGTPLSVGGATKGLSLSPSLVGGEVRLSVGKVASSSSAACWSSFGGRGDSPIVERGRGRRGARQGGREGGRHSPIHRNRRRRRKPAPPPPPPDRTGGGGDVGLKAERKERKGRKGKERKKRNADSAWAKAEDKSASVLPFSLLLRWRRA